MDFLKRNFYFETEGLSIRIKVGSRLFYVPNTWGTCVESRIQLFAQPNVQHKSQAPPPKSVAM